MQDSAGHSLRIASESRNRMTHWILKSSVHDLQQVPFPGAGRVGQTSSRPVVLSLDLVPVGRQSIARYGQLTTGEQLSPVRL
jgi:hypothetical protein